MLGELSFEDSNFFINEKKSFEKSFFHLCTDFCLISIKKIVNKKIGILKKLSPPKGQLISKWHCVISNSSKKKKIGKI